MFFHFLEETKQAELDYSIELTKDLEEPLQELIQSTFVKNIINRTKNEKCYYMTTMTELFLVSMIIVVNVVPNEAFSFLKLPQTFLNATIWSVLLSLCTLVCIAIDNLFQFRDRWQKEKELVNALKNECLKYIYKLGIYGQNLEQQQTKALFLQRFLELTGEGYSLFEYEKGQKGLWEQKIQQESSPKKERNIKQSTD